MVKQENVYSTLNVADVTVRLTRESAWRSPVCELMELNAKRGLPLSSREKPTTEPLGYLSPNKRAHKKQNKPKSNKQVNKTASVQKKVQPC